jgi:hypothetical protein
MGVVVQDRMWYSGGQMIGSWQGFLIDDHTFAERSWLLIGIADLREASVVMEEQPLQLAGSLQKRIGFTWWASLFAH